MRTNPKNLTEMLIPPSATVHRHYESAIPTPPTPHNLRQSGWRVVIHHLRRGETRHTTYATARSLVNGDLLSGGDYEMQASGGYTKVELWEPHRRTDELPSAVGTARCSMRDAYCKKTGVGVALRRALASLRAEVR